MAKAMIITVGMGREVENAIASSIKSGNPELVCFLATKKSQPTLEKVKEIFQKELRQLPPHQIFEISDENDLEVCYLKANEVFRFLVNKGYHSSDIATDFTSGTKPMSASVALAAISFEVPSFSYVAGLERNENGRVITGTERVTTFPSNIVFRDIQKKLAVKFFNQYQYEAAKEVLSSIQPKDEETKFLLTLTSAYNYWDKFAHEEALEKLVSLRNSADLLRKWKIKSRVENDKETLHRERHDKYSPAIIADLLQNAKRRAEEGKYDDAVARLYRLLEFLAQYKLYSGHNQIETSSLDLKKIPKNLREKYEKLKSKEGKISLSLHKAYGLLNDLGDPLGKKFTEDEKIKKVLGMRNDSLLAHGFVPVDKDGYQKSLKIASEYANFTISNLEFLEKEAKFPKLIF